MARRILAIAAVSTLLLALVPSGLAQSPNEIARRRHLQRILPMMSGQVMLRLADRLGITNIQGKALLKRGPFPTRPPGPTGADAPVPGFTVEDENEPSVAVNPAKPEQVVAFMHEIFFTVNCVVFYSTDGGVTWTRSGALPLLPGDSCSDPVVRWSRDGTSVYASYMSIRGDDSTADIVVSRSSTGGASWTGPVVAIQGVAPDFPDKPWLGVHGFDNSQANWVYVTTTNFRGNGTCDIVFNASSDNAASFPTPMTPVTLASAPGCNPVVVQGSNVTGGMGPNVLACWYNSGTDGWLNGAFNIRCRSSADHGAAWGAEVSAVANLQYELPFWLCPTSNYYRVWGAMFPQVRIAPNGSAHMVFTHDPTAGSGNGECGDIVYVRSSAPPYATWTSPVKISGGRGTNKTAQNYATISIEARSGSPGYRLYAAWVDQRGPNASPNIFYHIFRTHSDNGGSGWASNVRLTTAASLTDFVFIGDYIDAASTAIVGPTIRTHFIWTDRRDKTSFFDIFDPEDDVFHASVP